MLNNVRPAASPMVYVTDLEAQPFETKSAPQDAFAAAAAGPYLKPIAPTVPPVTGNFLRRSADHVSAYRGVYGVAAVVLVGTAVLVGALCGTLLPREAASHRGPLIGAGNTTASATPTLSVMPTISATPTTSVPTGTPTVTPPANGTQTPNGTSWLYTQGNKVYQAPLGWSGMGTPPNGTLWRGRGANVQDTRNCGVCINDIPTSEVKRRIDALSAYGANYMRLTLQSDTVSEDLINDPAYLADIKDIVAHIGTKPQTYVQVSIWIDPSLTAEGRPTPATDLLLVKLTEAFGNQPHVLLGVANEPKRNFDGSNDTLVWRAEDAAVNAIRQQEWSQGTPQHLISVQGTRNWAADSSYYINHPIGSGFGENILYEMHVYTAEDTFKDGFLQAAKVLPVEIGEFGPVNGTGVGNMTITDAEALMKLARENDTPHLAWNFSPTDCAPALLVNEVNATNACGVGAALVLSDWGNAWEKGMKAPWN